MSLCGVTLALKQTFPMGSFDDGDGEQQDLSIALDKC